MAGWSSPHLLPAVLEEQRDDPTVLAKGLRNCSTCFWLWVGQERPVRASCVHWRTNQFHHPEFLKWLGSLNDEHTTCLDYKMSDVERKRREKADADQSPNAEP